ncbi:hypothetical protein PanWU01x14_120700 [Parasponia andersonii]|uniref:Transmembrane protein n=1 Tax=Parasponia andersonii TaxID=3476 RepID=A0A2P5CV01_PARAD|nr:hypothetical protein PanWU01x14_120700 [Parasponia andersonii]
MFSVGCNDENFVAVCETSSIFYFFSSFFFSPVKCSFSRGKVEKLEESAEAASIGHFGGSNLWMHSWYCILHLFSIILVLLFFFKLLFKAFRNSTLILMQ